MVNARDLATAAVVAAMYALLVASLPMISFMLWQVRIADALLMLSTVLGWPAIVGVTVGCFIGNFTAPWGTLSLVLVDAVLGSSANLVASYVAYKVAYGRGFSHKVLAAFLEIIIVSVVVGSYIKYLLEWAFNVNMPIIASILGVVPGSIIAIGFLGTILALAVERRLADSRGAE